MYNHQIGRDTSWAHTIPDQLNTKKVYASHSHGVMRRLFSVIFYYLQDMSMPHPVPLPF